MSSFKSLVCTPYQRGEFKKSIHTTRIVNEKKPQTIIFETTCYTSSLHTQHPQLRLKKEGKEDQPLKK